MQQCNNLPSYIYLLTPVIIVIGWVVINSQSNFRETRKEIRSNIDTIKDKLQVIEETAVKYHTSDVDEYAALRIKMQLDRISSEIRNCYPPLIGNFNFYIFQLRKSITLKNFDTHEHDVLLIDHELIANIADWINRVEVLLEESYNKRFRMGAIDRFFQFINQRGR